MVDGDVEIGGVSDREVAWVSLVAMARTGDVESGEEDIDMWR